MQATVSAQLNRIADQLDSLKSLNDPTWIQPEFVGAALASSAALLIALFGEPIRRWWIKTTLKVIRITSHIQGGGGLIVYRLLISNEGNHKAQDVEVTVEKLFEDNNERKNFLPVPLGWTHAGAYLKSPVVRDIHLKQPVYLDLCEFIYPQRDGQGVTDAVLRLRAEAGQEIPDFNRLKKGKTRLMLKAYQADGKPLPVNVNIEWDGNNKPKINLIK